MASLTRMEDIAKDLPEYELVGEMGGVGRVTRVALIAQIGDVRRFKNKHSLICFAGLTRECKIVCVNRYCMNLLYAPYWGKQR